MWCNVRFAHHYKGEIQASKEFIKHHKKWAKEFHSLSVKERYLIIVQQATGNPKVEIKPSLLKIAGMTTKNSMNSYKSKGEMGIVIGAPKHAWQCY